MAEKIFKMKHLKKGEIQFHLDFFSRVKRIWVPGRRQAACVRPGSSMGHRLALCLPLLMLATSSELSAQGI